MHRTARSLPSLLLALILSPHASATTFNVDTTSDAPDGDVSDGICSFMANPDPSVASCSLRAAVMQANAIPIDPEVPVISINLAPGEKYFVDGPDVPADVSGATGDLDISRPMEIGVPAMFVKAQISSTGDDDRLFDIYAGAIRSRLFGLTMRNPGRYPGLRRAGEPRRKRHHSGPY